MKNHSGCRGGMRGFGPFAHMKFGGGRGPWAWGGPFAAGAFAQQFSERFGGGEEPRSNYDGVPVNILETPSTYELYMYAPGLRKQDIVLGIRDNVLTISYATPDVAEDDKAEWVRREYRRDAFKRSFELKATINADAITASYQDGVLHVTLPKTTDAQTPWQNIAVG